jgi:membrane associated rhomboid family serine protease
VMNGRSTRCRLKIQADSAATLECRIGGVSILQRYAPLFSSMFLHGGFMHLFGNMLYLWIFGNTLEDRLGHGRFGLLYVLCGLGAALTQI